MDLSVIIVNYNVSLYLRQCLASVYAALGRLQAEVFVVDNASRDDSVEMVAKEYPEVRLIVNPDNPGFAKANNQAYATCCGRYVLLLNPDTVVAEDCLEEAVSFMDAHPEAGGLGVKMTDGYGRFLKESKRGQPTAWVSFCKMTGLGRLFPKSKMFGRYHLGFLDENETHRVDILAGAFMLMRRTALDEVGMLDERFFMYGEDIDLSYRLRLGGYANYYHPRCRILHYKGESTKKGSLNYIRVFYHAMELFARKHYRGRFLAGYSALIRVGVWTSGAVGAVSIFGRKAWFALRRSLRRLFRYRRPSRVALVGPDAQRVFLEAAKQRVLESLDRSEIFLEWFKTPDEIVNPSTFDVLILSDTVTDARQLLDIQQRSARSGRLSDIFYAHPDSAYVVGPTLHFGV